MSKFKRKKNQIGVDKFGLPIYKREKYHHSSATLETFLICEHFCLDCHKKWSHKIAVDISCNLGLYSLCEDEITFGLNVTREEKVKMMTPSQQSIIKAYERNTAKQKKKI